MYEADVVIEGNKIVGNRSLMDGGALLLNTESHATIRNNIIDSNQSFRFGGAISIVGASSPLIYANTITNNDATGAYYDYWGSGGGGIFIDQASSPQIVKNVIQYNVADHAGGGISVRKDARPLIMENEVSYNEAAYGGGIHVESEGSYVRITQNDIKNNTAWRKSEYAGSGFGGGVSVYDQSNVEMRLNSVENNVGQSGGGGVVVSENGVLSLKANGIFGNRTDLTDGQHYSGGGIYVANGAVYMQNNVFHLNEACIGGAIALDAGAQAEIQHNTIVGNRKSSHFSPQVAGGINVRSSVGSVVIFNNIITQNEGYQVFEDAKKSIIQNNLINDDDAGSSGGMYYNYTSGPVHDSLTLNTSAAINADSNVSGSEAFRDTSSRDYSLLDSSVAIDIGKSGVGVDYSGLSRPFGSASDAGAYEKTTEINERQTVYRFWSPTYSRHFYTISSTERDTILNQYPAMIWKIEGEAYHALPIESCAGRDPVYRFWSDEKKGHFYTISEAEKNHVIATYPENVWKYEGVAFCAFKNETTKNQSLYRFWSDAYQGHFYTSSEAEKKDVEDSYPDDIWRYEGVGYYVYPID